MMRVKKKLGFDVAYNVKKFSEKLNEYDGIGYNLFIQYKCSHPLRNSSAIGYDIWSPDYIPFMRFKIHNTESKQQLVDLLSLAANFKGYEQVFYCTNSSNNQRLYTRNTSTGKYQKLFFYIPVSKDLLEHEYCSHHPGKSEAYLHSEPVMIKKTFSEVLDRSNFEKMNFSSSINKVRNSIADFQGENMRAEISRIESNAKDLSKIFRSHGAKLDNLEDIFRFIEYKKFLKEVMGINWSYFF